MEGIVTKSTGSWYTVKQLDGTKINARIKGKFRIKGIKSTNPIAVGDRVKLDLEQDGTGVIYELIDRKNYIVRKATKLSKQTHILAANLDQVALIVGVGFPKTPFGFIDRFLATAEAYDIPVLLIFNKVDLCNDEMTVQLDSMYSIYESLGYACIKTSAEKAINLDLFMQALKDKTTLISGQSGVGKTSLVNAIEPTLNLKTTSISEYNEKGRHTTTFAEMFEFTFGGNIIDTPGIRSFGVVDFDKNLLSHYFKEIFNVGRACKFSNCNHIEEPKCAVRSAVEDGEIAESRYTSYWNLYFDENLETDY